MQKFKSLTGEGLIFGIDEGRVEEFLESRGFEDIKDAGSDFLKNTYFTGVNQKRGVVPGYAIVHAGVMSQEGG